jgi:hypothetical protein
MRHLFRICSADDRLDGSGAAEVMAYRSPIEVAELCRAHVAEIIAQRCRSNTELSSPTQFSNLFPAQRPMGSLRHSLC